MSEKIKKKTNNKKPAKEKKAAAIKKKSTKNSNGKDTVDNTSNVDIKEENSNGNSNGVNRLGGEEVKLTGKQELFCHEYLVDFHETNAAIRAGYSKKSALSIGSENLRKPDIQARLRVLTKEFLAETDRLAAKTVRQLEAVGNSDITDYVLIGKGNKQTEVKDLSTVDTRAIAAVEVTEHLNAKTRKVIDRKVKLKLWDKPKSLDILTKVTKLQTNEINLTGSVHLKVDTIGIKEKILEKLLLKQRRQMKGGRRLQKERKDKEMYEDDGTNS